MTEEPKPVAWRRRAGSDDVEWNCWGKAARPTFADNWEPLYAAPVAAQGWQGIESAPDETDVLVWCAPDAYWDGSPPEFAVARKEGGHWRLADEFAITPTHWQPLPAPPPGCGGK